MALVSLKKQLEAPRISSQIAAGAARSAPAERRAASAEPAAGNGRYELKRNLLLNLKRPDLERASSVSLDLQVEDAEHHVVHRVRDFRLALAPQTGTEEILLRLLIALNSEE